LKLAPVDALRRSTPDYRLGWDNPVPAGSAPPPTNAAATPAVAAMADEFAHAGETYASDDAWEQELEHACTRIRDRQTASPDDAEDCNRQHSRTPICIAYRNFAFIWYDMRDDKTPDVNWFDEESKGIDSLGTAEDEADPEYYGLPAFKRTLHHILNIAFAQDRSSWHDRSQFSLYVYKSCLEDHPLEATTASAASLAVPDKIERGWLGLRVQEVTPEIAESLGLPKPEGALVVTVNPGGPAEKIGIKQGDVIEALGEHAIVKRGDLSLAVAGTPVGQTPSVKLWRNGHEMTFAPTVVAMPKNLATSAPLAPAAQAPILALPPDQKDAIALPSSPPLKVRIDRRVEELSDGAARKFCSTATLISCSRYINDLRSHAEQCRVAASSATSYLAKVRMWTQKGLTPSQAARKSSLSLGWLADAAAQVPDTTTPDEFSMQVLNQCLGDVAGH
jgi:hypothetical protein